MSRPARANLAESITFAGHALLWAMAGVAILADRVVGVARTPANVAVGIGMIIGAVLLVLDAFGLVPPRWGKAGWAAFAVTAAAFFAINF